MPKAMNVLLILLGTFALIGCGELKLDISEIGSSGLSGTLKVPATYLNLSAFSQSTQSCAQLNVSLHKLNSNGTMHPNALMTAPVINGAFSFKNIEQAGVEVKTTAVDYMVAISGCDAVLYRPVTGLTNQDLTGASTLLSLTKDLPAAGRKSLSAIAPTDLEKVINALDGTFNTNDLTSLLNNIIANGSASQKFESLMEAAPIELKDLPPVRLAVLAPAMISENSSSAYSVSVIHWNQDYVPAFEWVLNGTPQGVSNAWTYVTGKNSQGSKTLTIRVGKDNGGSLDILKPIFTETVSIQIANEFPAVVPPATLVGPYKRNFVSGNVQITTGIALANCATFSGLALNESSVVPPLNPSAYSHLCSQAGVQDLPFTLSATEGLKTVAIWARDSAGNISQAPSTVSVLLDHTPPALSFSNLNSAYAGANTVSVQFTATDALSGMASVTLEYSDGGAFVAAADLTGVASPYSWTAPAGNVAAARLRLTATDQAGNTSQVTSGVFAIDSTPPTLTILTPAALTPAKSGVTITGACETGLTVDFSGAGLSNAQSVNCVSGAYSFAAIFTASDGTKNIIASQTDAAGNSTTLNRDFARDNAGPSFSITSHTSNQVVGANITLTGTCEVGGSSVVISSAAMASAVNSACSAGGTFSSALTFTAASGNITVSIAQNDVAGNTGSLTHGLVLDVTPPLLAILTPSALAAYKTGATIAGTCESGRSVSVSGTGITGTPTDLCLAGSFSIAVTFSAVDGTKSMTFEQSDAVGNTNTVAFSLVRDNVAPTFTQTLLAASLTTNTDTVTYGGACEVGTTVNVTGAEIETASCAVGGTWTFATNKTADGAFAYTFAQADQAGNSTSANTTWTRDTIAVLTWTSPVNGTAAQSKVTAIGACEPGQTIYYSGSGLLSTFNAVCAGGGTYSQDLFFTAGEGSKVLTITQTDSFGNVGTITRTFVRDTTGPSLTQTLRSSPYYTSGNTASFSGACEPGTTVAVTVDAINEGTAACNSGAWTYTTATQSTDADRLYSFSQADTAGNLSTVTARWVRDTQMPTLTVTPASLVTASASVTFSGSCESGLPASVQVSGADTSSASCSGGVWSYAVGNQTTNQVRNYAFTLTDQAGNSKTVNATWERNTNVPNLLILTADPVINSLNSASISGNCQAGETVEIKLNGLVEGTLSCPGGTFTYTTSGQTTDADRVYEFKQTNTATNGLTTTQSIHWKRDTTPPTLTAGSFTINGNAAVSLKARVSISFQASDNMTNVTQFCLKTGIATKPLSNDSCWKAVDGPGINLTPAQTLTLNNYGFTLPITPDTYTVYAWVKDQVGLISDLTNGSAGTDQRDRDQIDYVIPIPPKVEAVLIGSNDYPAEPPSGSDLTVASAAPIYLKWRVTDDKVLPANPISVEFTQDDSNWTEIAANLINGVNGACTINNAGTTADDTMTGCYRISTSPTSTYLKFRVIAKDSDGLKAGNSSLPLNVSSQLRFIAGNTDQGTNLSAQSAMFFFRLMDVGTWTSSQSLAVTRDGKILFNDENRGILIVDPADGLQKVLVRKSGGSTGDGGPIANATVFAVTKITLDHAEPVQNLWIFDYDRIRKVNLATGVIDTVVGGAAATDDSDTVDNPRLAWVKPLHSDGDQVWWTRNPFFALPNGDFYFQAANDGYVSSTPVIYSKLRLRYYEAATGKIKSFRVSDINKANYIGTNNYNSCQVYNFSFSHDANSNIVDRLAQVRMHLSLNGCNTYGDRTVLVDFDSSGVSQNSPFPQTPLNAGSNIEDRVAQRTGLDGRIFAIGKSMDYLPINGIFVYDSVTKAWTRVLGDTANAGNCVDGAVAATNCRARLGDAFITENGSVFFLDDGLIRTIKPDGKVATLMGQKQFSEDGNVPARQARLGSYLYTFRMADDGRLSFLSPIFAKGYDIDPNGNMHHIIGNGNWGNAALNVDATTTAMNAESPNSSGSDMGLDPVTGDIYHNAGDWRIARFTRYNSNIGSKGQWILLNGNNGPNNWSDAEGTNDLSYTNNQTNYDDVTYFAHQAWFPPRVLGIGFGELLMTKSDLSLYRTNGAHRIRNSMMKLVNTTTGANRHFTGAAGYSLHDDLPTVGAPVATSPHWAEDADRSVTPYPMGPSRWLIVKSWERTVYDMTRNGTVLQFASLVQRPKAFTYRKNGGDEYIYYCSHDSLRLRRHHVQSSNDIELAWPVPSMTCAGSAMFFRSQDQSIVFGYRQNGLMGYAKYLDPL